MAKVICVLYDDPIGGYPKSYARDDIPRLERYPGGQTLPSPKKIDFKPGQLLGSVSGELGLRKFLEEQGHTLVVTSDKDGPDSLLERELPNAEIVISQPFWPAYLTAARIASRVNGAGLRRDHDQLPAAPRDRAFVQRHAHRQDETRRVHRQHRTRQDLRSGCDCECARERSTGRVRRRCLVPATGAAGSPLADDAAPWNDPHISGSTLSAQTRYAAGTREILECWFSGRPIRDEYLIVHGGKLAGVGAHSYSAGNATGGSEEAVRFKK